MLPLLAHHYHRRTTPFIDWANGIKNAQQQEIVHAYQI
jgi:hypothetical protein